MRRALILIIVLTVLCFGGGLSLDMLQRETAQQYLAGLDNLRTLVIQNRMEEARAVRQQVGQRWEQDAQWLKCVIGHHHTRAVDSALRQLSTALQMDWRMRTLLALDEAVDAIEDIRDAEFLTLENVL